MASASSSSSAIRSAIRRRGPFISIIACPDCGRLVKRGVSGTPDHPGWTYYKCNRHGYGCIFWHWELEYVSYLVDHDFLVGEAAVEAVCWADERREELKARQAEKEATGDAGAAAKEEKILKHVETLVDAVNKVLLFLKIVFSLLCVFCVLIIVKK